MASFPYLPCVFVLGPTASGKSALALEALASCGSQPFGRFMGPVINGDAQQVYRDFPILSACPSSQDYEKWPHELYGIQSYEACFQAMQEEEEKKGIFSSQAWSQEVFSRTKHLWENQGKIPWIVGGSGFYIKSLCQGLSPLEPVPLAKRLDWLWKQRGTDTSRLYQELQSLDPDRAKALTAGDRQRIQSSLIIAYETGRKPSQWYEAAPPKPFPVLPYFFILSHRPYEGAPLAETKKRLTERISLRLDHMLAQGALEEVTTGLKRLSFFPELKQFLTRPYDQAPTSLQAFKLQEFIKKLPIGCVTLFRYHLGQITLSQAKEAILISTRQYAKRQVTWFYKHYHPRERPRHWGISLLSYHQTALSPAQNRSLQDFFKKHLKT